MSLMKIFNNNGPTLEPCGTPVVINCIDNFTPFVFTYSHRIKDATKGYLQLVHCLEESS